MIEAPLALGFAAGMVAAFNPCGFALVPAYLSFFLGGQDDGDDETGGSSSRSRAGALAPVARALVVGSAVTVGFVAVFGTAGVLATTFSLAVQRVAPWVSIPLGIALLVMGVAVLLGWTPTTTLPRLAVGGRSRGLVSMALYGASYATVSLSCTLPVFLAAVATTFDDANFASGVAVFMAYALGMGTVLTGLAVATALFRRPLAKRSPRLMPLVARLAGLLLATAGAYVTWYAVYSIRLQGDGEPAAGPVVTVTRWSGQVSNWVNEVEPGRIAGGVVLLFLVASAALLGRARTGATRPAPPEPDR